MPTPLWTRGAVRRAVWPGILVIPLAAATACALAERHNDIPFAYNRKEAKDRGEGGTLVGAALQGRVLIIDDAITAGTAIREAITMIEAAGASVAAVAIGLDRQSAQRAVGDSGTGTRARPGSH